MQALVQNNSVRTLPFSSQNVNSSRFFAQCGFGKKYSVNAMWQYIANDGVRDALIACHTSSINAPPVLEACLSLEYELAWNAWVTRVPRESNIAEMWQVMSTRKCGGVPA